jgi:hypothetical protein
MQAKRIDTVQTAVRLPRRLLDRLRQSAYGITEGIIRAVEQMFADEQLDWQTRELMAAISAWSSAVEREAGAPWHSHAGAHQVFRLAILKKLARMKPEGPTEFGERPLKIIDSDDPDTIAQALEYLEFHMQDTVRQARVREAEARTIQDLYERLNPEDRRKLLEQFPEALRERYPDESKKGEDK